MGKTKTNLATLYINRDPHQLQRGWGWVEMDQTVVQAYDLPNVTPPYPRLTPEGRYIYPPSRGQGKVKKLTLRIGAEHIYLRVQNSLTIKAVCTWVKSWAPPETQIISAGGYIYTTDGDKWGSSQAHCVYFILNRDSNAIKIGRAREIEKRLKALQTASPIPLELLKTIPLTSEAQAKGLEAALHGQFWHLRMQGEWFRAEPPLLHYIETGKLPP